MQVGTSNKAGSELHIWRAFLARATLGLGLLLLASAAICWVAANWGGMTKMQRLGDAQGLLTASALLAAWLYFRPAATRVAVHGRACVIGLAAVLLGALLALVGQTYQTGADNWELFATWAALLLPWAVAARSQGVWLLWIAVANLALALLLGERVLSWWVVFAGPGFPGLVVALANLIMLAVWEYCARRWRAGTDVGPRVLALLVVGVLTLALMFGESVLEGLGTYTGLAWVATTLILGFFYIQVRLDLVVLALLAAGIVCVSLRVVGEWLLSIEPGIWVALPLAALLMGESVVAARWLRRLAAGPAKAGDPEPEGASAGIAVEPRPSGTPVAQSGPDTIRRGGAPWYVQGLLALSAWMATLLLLVFVFFSGLVHTPPAALVVGLVLCAAAVAIARNARQPFWRQCATALGFAGQIVVAVGLSDANSVAGAAMLVLLLSAAVYVLAPDAILRFLSGLMMAMALFVLTAFTAGSNRALYAQMLDWVTFDALQGLAVWLPACVFGAWLAASAFVARENMPAARRDVLQPLAWAFALAAQAGALLAAGVPVSQLPALWHLHPPAAVFLVLAALLPVIAGWAMIRIRAALLPRAIRIGVPLGLLALAACWLPSPGIGFALTWVLLGFGLERPRLRRWGQAALLVYLVLYYYQLDVPLLQKAVWLAGAGILLLLMRLVLWRLVRRADAISPARNLQANVNRVAARPHPAWAAVLLLGLLLALGLVNAGIWQRERLLATGHIVRLALAPADPRALMQGDYMALRFAAARAVGQLQGDQPPSPGPWGGPRTDGYLVLAPDDKGVAQPLRVQPAVQPHGDNEIVLRYRLRADGVRLVTNAYFFPEGEATRYQAARYGELRVGDDGTGLLVQLLGPDLQPL
jgi:uncharacterized membrane-anchored protein/uncharacterized membrane protein